MTERDFTQDWKEQDYRRHILEALLVASASDSFKLPTIKEFILSEIVNGTIEHIGGNAGQIDYQKFRFDVGFERKLYEYLVSEMESRPGTLNPKVAKAINKLCEPCHVSPSGPGRPYPDTELYGRFKGFGGGGICPIITRSVFSLPGDLITRVQSEVLPSLSDQERTDIAGIGKAMRKYTDRDLEFIGRTHSW